MISSYKIPLYGPLAAVDLSKLFYQWCIFEIPIHRKTLETFDLEKACRMPSSYRTSLNGLLPKVDFSKVLYFQARQPLWGSILQTLFSRQQTSQSSIHRRPVKFNLPKENFYYVRPFIHNPAILVLEHLFLKIRDGLPVDP